MTRIDAGRARLPAAERAYSDHASPAIRAGATLGLSGDLSVSFDGLTGSAEDARRFFAEGLGATRLRLPPPVSAGALQGALLLSVVEKGRAAAGLGPAEGEMISLLDGLTRLQAEVRQEAARPLPGEVER